MTLLQLFFAIFNKVKHVWTTTIHLGSWCFSHMFLWWLSPLPLVFCIVLQKLLRINKCNLLGMKHQWFLFIVKLLIRIEALFYSFGAQKSAKIGNFYYLKKSCLKEDFKKLGRAFDERFLSHSEKSIFNWLKQKNRMSTVDFLIF